ncbi:DUF4397 domain-containing protein [Haloferax namakaokahaiae]|uniref:DUF4397 domain-containing protein n=1 Tax=Haloferax namakaokahaiae TaxID=1748331 RepID=A0ABD5ZE25_9EURY
MTDTKRRDVLRAVGGLTVIGGLAGCMGGTAGGDQTETETPTDSMTETPTTETPTPESEMAMVRVAHLAPDAPDVDIYVDGEVALSGVSFSAVSDYLSVPVGTRTVAITPAGDDSTTVFEDDLELAEATYTVAAVGELGEETFQPLVLEDDVSSPGEDMARVRVVHASPDAPAVDITAGDEVLFDGVEFTQSGSVTVPADTYTLQVRGDTESNDGDAVAEFDLELAGDSVYTVFAAGYLTPDDEPTMEEFRPIVTVDSGTEGGLVEPAVSLRVAHLSPDAPNVDVLVDGEAVLTDVPFGTVSDYLMVDEGTYQVTVQAAGDPETVVFDESLDLAAGAYTAAAVGELEEDAENPFMVQILEDDRSEPEGETARVRVFHASPDAPAVDVTVASSGDVLVDGLAYGETATVDVPAGEYTVEVRGDTDSNDGDVVGEFGLAAEAGYAYTAIALGYLTPDDEPTDAEFDLSVVIDN